MKKVLFCATAISLISPTDASLEFVSITFWTGADDPAIEGEAGSCVFWQTISILDISDPSRPSPVRDIDGGIGGNRIAVTDSVAYIAADEGLALVDVSDPRSPVEVGSLLEDAGFRGAYQTNSAWTGGRIALMANDVNLQIVDVSQPDNPRLLPTVDSELEPFDVTARVTSLAAASGSLAPFRLGENLEAGNYGICPVLRRTGASPFNSAGYPSNIAYAEFSYVNSGR